MERLIADQKVEQIQTTTTAPTPKIVFNAEADRQFLRTSELPSNFKQVIKFINKVIILLVSLDTYASYWKRGIGAQFVNTFPVISVVVAIIWTAMCLIFQTGRKKNS